MSAFRLTRLAEADIDSIGEHALETWGAEQARSYLADLDLAFTDLSTHPHMGRKRDDLRGAPWVHRCGSHLIFFRRTLSGPVDILRILHDRMDSDRHL